MALGVMPAAATNNETPGVFPRAVGVLADCALRPDWPFWKKQSESFDEKGTGLSRAPGSSRKPGYAKAPDILLQS